MGFLSGLFGSEQEQKSKPYGPAVPYMNRAMSQVGGLNQPVMYTGNMTAGMNAPMWSALDQAGGWYGGQGGAITQGLQNMGQVGATGMWNQLGALYDYGQQGPAQFQYDQALFNQTMGNLQPGLQGAYNSAMRDPMRQYSEQMIPGINQGAAMSGQAFGTRPQNQSAIAARGLADRGADVASGLWMNAANQANANAMQGGLSNLQSGQNHFGQLMSGYGNLGALGLQGYNQANQAGLGNIGLGLRAGDYRQLYEQGALDRNVNAYNQNQLMPWQYGPLQQLNAYQGVGQSFGTNTMNTSQGVGNIAAGLAGAWLGGGGGNPFQW